MSSSRGCAVAVLLTLLASGVTAQEMSNAQRDVWLLEEAYWRYVTANDIESYKSLWHKDFVGWPGGAPAPVGDANIADWIGEMHGDSTRRYDYALRRIAVVPFGDDIVVTHELVEYRLREGRTPKGDTLMRYSRGAGGSSPEQQ